MLFSGGVELYLPCERIDNVAESGGLGAVVGDEAGEGSRNFLGEVVTLRTVGADVGVHLLRSERDVEIFSNECGFFISQMKIGFAEVARKRHSSTRRRPKVVCRRPAASSTASHICSAFSNSSFNSVILVTTFLLLLSIGEIKRASLLSKNHAIPVSSISHIRQMHWREIRYQMPPKRASTSLFQELLWTMRLSCRCSVKI